MKFGGGFPRANLSSPDPPVATGTDCEIFAAGSLRFEARKLLKFSLNRLRGRSIYGNCGDPSDSVFLAPPFTPDVVQAIRRISTRLPLKSDEASRIVWQSENNACSRNEYKSLQAIFAHIPKPQKILEIGPGFGRSVAFFQKKGVWSEQAAVHLYDADGIETKYKQRYYEKPPQWPDTSSFCGSLELLNATLLHNGIYNYEIHDAGKVRLHTLPGPYDLIYGFYSIGFHWSLQHYLDDLEPLMSPHSLFVCTLNKHFVPFKRLNEYSTRIVECEDIKKGARPIQILLMSRNELPAIGKTLREAFSK